jgi:hypothetical protein
MAPNTISRDNLTAGAPWTFVHTGGPRAGEHTFYEYAQMVLPGGPGNDKQGGQPLSPMHTLRNVSDPTPSRSGHRDHPEQQMAYVSEKWLHEGMIGNGQHGYWLTGHVAAPALPVAA